MYRSEQCPRALGYCFPYLRWSGGRFSFQKLLATVLVLCFLLAGETQLLGDLTSALPPCKMAGLWLQSPED